MTTPTWIKRGFLLSGFINIVGILTASHCYMATAALSKWDAGAFGTLGITCIILWGLAYIAAADKVAAMPNLALVFFVEKSVYFANWLVFLKASGAQLGEIREQALLPGLFLSIYGINDLIFGIFFAVAFIKLRQSKPVSQ